MTSITSILIEYLSGNSAVSGIVYQNLPVDSGYATEKSLLKFVHENDHNIAYRLFEHNGYVTLYLYKADGCNGTCIQPSVRIAIPLFEASVTTDEDGIIIIGWDNGECELWLDNSDGDLLEFRGKHCTTVIRP